jgi:hypothetical protein
MKGRSIPYSDDELAWLEANRMLSISDYHAAFLATFARSDVSARHLHALRKRKGWSTGRTGQFVRGEAPANKGKKCPPGKGGNHPNARATQFRRGQRTGKAAENYKPVGTERLSKDGYVERKIHDGLPLQSRWRSVHLIEWEEMNGPIPAGMCLKCIDGDKSNTDPANWKLIPRAMLPRLNGKYGRDYDNAPAELKPLIMRTAELQHIARNALQARKSGGA